MTLCVSCGIGPLTHVSMMLCVMTAGRGNFVPWCNTTMLCLIPYPIDIVLSSVRGTEHLTCKN